MAPGLTPAGSSHYGTFYLGQIEQGDDSPNAEFLDYVRDNDLGDYAMVAISLKDNTPAGGYGQMINQGAADFNSNAIWESLDDIRNGAWDAQIDSFAQTMASRPDTQFLVRVGYEVSLLLFAYNGDEHVVDWLEPAGKRGVSTSLKTLTRFGNWTVGPSLTPTTTSSIASSRRPATSSLATTPCEVLTTPSGCIRVKKTSTGLASRYSIMMSVWR